MAQLFSKKLISTLNLCVKYCSLLFLGAIKSGVVTLIPYAITFESENELHFWVHEQWCACLLQGLQTPQKSKCEKCCDKRKSGSAVMQATCRKCEPHLRYTFFPDVLVHLYTLLMKNFTLLFCLDKTHTMETCSSSSHTSVMKSGFELRFPSFLGVAFSIKRVQLGVI